MRMSARRELGSRAYFCYEILQKLAHGGLCRHILGNSSAEKVLAVQFLLHVKLFIGVLGSREHFSREILQKQVRGGSLQAVLGNHRGIRLQILQNLKKCDRYERIIENQ